MSEKSTFWDKISSISTLFGAIAAAVAAIAAAYTVSQTAKSYQGQLEINRPYFMVTDQGFEPRPDSSRYKFIISLKNIGGRPAKAFYVDIYSIPSELKGSPNSLYGRQVFNQLASGEIIRFPNINKYTKEDLSSRYIYIVFKYRDSLTDKHYLQRLVYKDYPDLMPTSNEEAGKVLKFLEEQGTDQDAFKDDKLIDE